MIKRTEYYDDPTAPQPNTLVPAASAIIVDDDGAVLLHRRADSELWSIPGGGMEIGESIARTVAREVKEETGLDVAIERLVGIYSDPRFVVAYADGEVRQQFSICFSCRVVGGSLAASDESSEVRFFPSSEVAALPMGPGTRVRLRDFQEGGTTPVIA
ncbi:MAG TPA: NUDIX domain-containing protein [Mycobacteriales bacterium]|nr:NUDIX domain-containing protein [Mycobacteriales bacterium]